jgi:hypothetical protein
MAKTKSIRAVNWVFMGQIYFSRPRLSSANGRAGLNGLIFFVSIRVDSWFNFQQ